jgi:hypothetical protein
MSLSAAGSQGAKAISRSAPQLYRDCLRLVQHIAGKSKKGDSIRKIVRQEFKKNSGLTDHTQIEHLKSHAVRGLANYLMIESTAKDAKLQKSANTYANKLADDLKKTT